MCNLSTEESMQIAKKWLRQMAQPFTREDQLGISLLTYEQLQTEEMQEKIQKKVSQIENWVRPGQRRQRERESEWCAFVSA
jgi:hypothetical protein